MRWRGFVSAAVLCVTASPLWAAPLLNVVPGGVQGDNWVWDVSITPDFAISPGGTPMAVELGFRLTGAGLTSATNINPAEWDSPNPGTVIFGWETLTDVDPGPIVNNRPVGLQTNVGTGEIFVAYGSIDFTTPGAKPFLKILAPGPTERRCGTQQHDRMARRICRRTRPNCAADQRRGRFGKLRYLRRHGHTKRSRAPERGIVAVRHGNSHFGYLEKALRRYLQRLMFSTTTLRSADL